MSHGTDLQYILMIRGASGRSRISKRAFSDLPLHPTFRIFVHIIILSNHKQNNPKTEQQMVTRKEFLRQLSMMGAGLVMSPFIVQAAEKVGPNDKIRVGLIGLQRHGI